MSPHVWHLLPDTPHSNKLVRTYGQSTYKLPNDGDLCEVPQLSNYHSLHLIHFAFLDTWVRVNSVFYPFLFTTIFSRQNRNRGTVPHSISISLEGDPAASRTQTVPGDKHYRDVYNFS